jgi:hypothetical protein
MKNSLLFFAFFFCAGVINSQSYEHKWNVGLHGGFTQYNGDLGDGFYRFNKAFYGHGGISVNRYLSRRWDATLLATKGAAGYFGEWHPDPSVPTNFLIDLTTFNLLAKYKFLHPESFIRPYVFAGPSLLMQRGVGDHFVDRPNKFDFAGAGGAGINFHFGKFITFQIQEMFMYTGADDVDRLKGGMNDMYVFHTAGLTFNIGKLGKLGGPTEPDGVGSAIDKCPKVKQHRNKATKSQSQKLRKEKKSKRLAARKAKRSKS